MGRPESPRLARLVGATVASNKRGHENHQHDRHQDAGQGPDDEVLGEGPFLQLLEAGDRLNGDDDRDRLPEAHQPEQEDDPPLEGADEVAYLQVLRLGFEF